MPWRDSQAAGRHGVNSRNQGTPAGKRCFDRFGGPADELRQATKLPGQVRNRPNWPPRDGVRTGAAALGPSRPFRTTCNRIRSMLKKRRNRSDRKQRRPKPANLILWEAGLDRHGQPIVTEPTQEDVDPVAYTSLIRSRRRDGRPRSRGSRR